MAIIFEGVDVGSLNEEGSINKYHNNNVRLEICTNLHETSFNIYNGVQLLQGIPLSDDFETIKIGSRSAIITCSSHSYIIRFKNVKDAKSFRDDIKSSVAKRKSSVFNQRTDPASAEQYFQFYGYLSQQQNMMQDYIRTSTYQRAMLDNAVDFQGKVVLDVGAGSGILSFFAIQAGAKKVYAIEASSMAQHCEALVQHNVLPSQIVVMAGKIEEVEVPEKVDIIISEPMGYMLFNERMLETYLHAKKWMKPGGKMFPTQADLHIAPFTDDSLYMEQCSKANFWYQESFHGVDLSCLRIAAIQEYFKQPIVDTFDIRICMSRSFTYTVDFQTANESDLHDIDIPLTFTIQQTGNVHGLAFWFDVAFIGSQCTVWLSTAPTQPLTHWYQVRCLFPMPIFVRQGQSLAGRVHLRSNTRQSYDVDMELSVDGTDKVVKNTLDLKNPFFRYTGQQPQAPPGTNNTSPTEAYWNQQDINSALEQAQAAGGYGVPLLNGGLNDGAQLLNAVQSGVMYNNLVPLTNIAPVNPGSIPIAAVEHTSGLDSLQNPTLDHLPAAYLPQSTSSLISTAQYPISNQYMIGDYVVPGNLILPAHQPTLHYKSVGSNS